MTETIRKLAPADRGPLEAVLRSDDSFRPDEIDVALELIDDALEKADSDYWVRVATIDDVVAGYICFGPTPMTQSTYDLYWIVTHSEFRGHGLASSLIKAMEAELGELGGTAIRVETSKLEGYTAARRLYGRLGYPETARFPDFYRPGDDLIVYYKQI